MPKFALVTIAALLGTLVLIFAFQADNITGRACATMRGSGSKWKAREQSQVSFGPKRLPLWTSSLVLGSLRRALDRYGHPLT
jgi:hypothetical protein